MTSRSFLVDSTETQDTVERKRLVIDVAVALELRVDRNQIVGAVDLDAVAGIIDHGDIGIAGLVGEFAQHAPRLQRREVLAGIDDFEARVLQRRCAISAASLTGLESGGTF